MGTWRAQRGLKVVEFVDRLTGVGYASWVIAGWSSPVARWAHNPKVVGSNPTPATMNDEGLADAGAANPFRLPRLHPGIGSVWARTCAQRRARSLAIPVRTSWMPGRVHALAKNSAFSSGESAFASESLGRPTPEVS